MPRIDDAVARLNFHHLRYFWLVAHEGGVTATAKRLRVSQSAVSSQLRQLEDHLGEALFERQGRQLVLTETGRLVLGYADRIFDTGGSLLALLRSGRSREDLLRIGAVATLSRNFQTSFLAPLFRTADARFRIESAPFDDLIRRLEAHDLDLALSNRPVTGPDAAGFHSQLVAQQEVSLIGHPRDTPLSFPDDLHHVPLLLPPRDSGLRISFDVLCERYGLQPTAVAEVDDMALLRLLTRDTDLVALLPRVVVRDELSSGELVEHVALPDLVERFYAIRAERRYQHPLLDPLLARDPGELLAMD